MEKTQKESKLKKGIKFYGDNHKYIKTHLFKEELEQLEKITNTKFGKVTDVREALLKIAKVTPSVREKISDNEKVARAIEKIAMTVQDLTARQVLMEQAKVKREE